MNRRRFLTLAASAPAAMTQPAAAAAGSKRKKGVGVVAKADGKWLPVVEKLKARWFYSWGSDQPKDVPGSVDFIPMVWGYWGDRAGIAKAGAAAKAAGIHELLGFNEPDQHDQSNLTVEKALAAWPELMKTGLRLGSPGCVHPDREWMKAFMEGVEKQQLRVDFVCVHSYGGTDANAFMKRLESVHKLYKKPLWITEFACGDWEAKSVAQNRHRPEQVLKFMKELLPRLEKCPFVERYAWFPAGANSAALGTSALFDQAGELTRSEGSINQLEPARFPQRRAGPSHSVSHSVFDRSGCSRHTRSMQAMQFDQSIGAILKRDKRFDPHAYFFLKEALDFTLKRIAEGSGGQPRHVSGPELLLGFRDLALDQFGPMAATLMTEWGVRKCSDVGDMVFNLIDEQVFGRQESDCKEDFIGNFDLEDALRLPFLPKVRASASAGPQRKSVPSRPLPAGSQSGTA